MIWLLPLQQNGYKPDKGKSSFIDLVVVSGVESGADALAVTGCSDEVVRGRSYSAGRLAESGGFLAQAFGAGWGARCRGLLDRGEVRQ